MMFRRVARRDELAGLLNEISILAWRWSRLKVLLFCPGLACVAKFAGRESYNDVMSPVVSFQK